MQSSDHSFVVSIDQPLIGIPVPGNGVEYVTTDEAVEATNSAETAREALSLLGVWSDLDWEGAMEQLDRIRHESKPTPLLDDV